MADEPDGSGNGQPGGTAGQGGRGTDLDRRRRNLGEALAARKRAASEAYEGAKTSGTAGFGYALRLSSEFIAAIIVGTGLGWIIDQGFGTSPWGLIVFLLLGFCAGILNVLRAAGLLAEFGLKKPEG